MNTVEQLKKIGGNEWITENHHRIYFNKLEEFVGLECSYYKTGNIKLAYLNDEHISNTKALRLLAGLKLAKLWFDVKTGEFAHKGLKDETANTIIERIKQKAGETND